MYSDIRILADIGPIVHRHQYWIGTGPKQFGSMNLPTLEFHLLDKNEIKRYFSWKTVFQSEFANCS